MDFKVDNAAEALNSLDLIWTAKGIGHEIGVSRRKAFHLLETHAIPARKCGGRWVAERGKLRDFFLEDAEGK